MPDFSASKNEFLSKITGLIEKNISDEQFGVSELAQAVGMSRSNLLRKINKLTGLSASQFIRQVRLGKAMGLLKEGSYNVSEVSFKVGFNSTSYFIKCFRDQYGYPPGEAGKRGQSDSAAVQIDQPSQSHQLAAIMFTDIQGFTTLMQQDEDKAVAFRKRHREVFKAVTKKFNGKILQYFGDGTLSTFPSAIDAVRCSIEMQLAFRQDPQIPVRIGIHTGDIIFTEDDIIGDGVNVASRIESLAIVGSVFISEKVYDEIKNQSGIQTAPMGLFELKNVDKPIEVFAITNPGLMIPEKDQISGKLKQGANARGRKLGFIWIFTVLVVIVVAYLAYNTNIFNLNAPSILSEDPATDKKSIAVLPFINDSDDSSNVYIVNGLMESLLNNLQKIKDLRVISRTSVEKYRNNPKNLAEIAKELNVNYIIEGSGQKIGDRVLLNIQLIEARSDRHLWSEQYAREAKDIFALQQEVAKSIISEIEVIVTPEEEERIEKIPTENLLAYDLFLKGLDLFYKWKLEEAITYFKEAIEEDSTFARAYADIAISYFYLDIFQAEKRYSDQINYYADRALLYDSKLAQSLVAKALDYINIGDYSSAVPILEKALEYNPNSAMVINILSDFYTSYNPNTAKYLEYALKGIKLEIAANDSATTSLIFLHISNAFVQSGFIDDAQYYINKSLDYDPENLYSHYVKAYILFAHNNDLKELKESLLETLDKDTTRLDVLQEVGKTCYYMRDYEEAYFYYKKFLYIREEQNLDIYKGENSKIALVLAKMGMKEESKKYLMDFKEYADNDNSVYQQLSLAAYYSYTGDRQKSLEHLKLFTQKENFFYWILIFLKIEPLFDNVKDLPEFKKINQEIESNFWHYHDQLKASLEEKGLLRP